MLESLFEKVLPLDILAPALLGLIAYGLLVFFGLSPIVQERMANKIYHPSCVAWIDKQDRLRIAAREDERKRVRLKRENIRAAARRAREKAMEEVDRALNMTKGLLGAPLLNLMDQFSGGDFRGRIRQSVPIPDIPSDAELNLPSIPDLLPQISLAAQKNTCSCVVRRALGESNIDFALYTAALRFYTPVKVARMDDRMQQIAVSPVCKAG